MAELCRRADALLVIDDRADIALLLNAGVHLGQDDLPPQDARRILGPGRIIGFSTHNPEQLRAAAAEPADYLAIGPIFGTQSKQRPDPTVGLARLAQWRRAERAAAGGHRRHHARRTRPKSWRPAPTRWPSSPTCCRNPRPNRRSANGWKNGKTSSSESNRAGQGAGPAGRDHARHGIDDRLGHLHRGRRHLPAGGIARPADGRPGW